MFLARSTKKAIITTVGMPLGAIMWQYGYKGITWLSDKATYFVKNTEQIPNDAAYWFKPELLVGVTISGQVFIEDCKKHSPVANFVGKSLKAFEYYSLFVISTTVIDAALKKWSNLDADINYYISVASGFVIGAWSGHKIQKLTGKHIDSGISEIGGFASAIIGGVSGAFESLIGKHHSY